jgi:NAD(P)-dependent dehydrogenase (short-subunit alcohol dehydrogenase family)
VEASGTVFVVTGANSGLGLETARRLASAPSSDTVILACRNLEKAETAKREIEFTTGNTHVIAMGLDLASMASVRDFVLRYRESVAQPIDALVCNAGVASAPRRTVDGLDGVFETNHLGHFLLALSLLNDMAPTGRVLSVSSDAHEPPGRALTWPGVDALATPRGFDRHRYSYSKLCNLYFTYEFARRLKAAGSGVVAAAFNPGFMPAETNFATMPRVVGRVIRRMFAERVGSLDTSSAALAELVTARPEIAGLYFDRTAAHPARSSELSHDEANASELWEFSERLTGVSF